jgi:hypothetical protein
MNTYLLTGNCGTGKTWVMNRLRQTLQANTPKQVGQYHWLENDKVVILGRYDGSTFEGSDKLSMSVMADNKLVLPLWVGKIVIAEGDRFTNQTFIDAFKPLIIRIRGSGADGRVMRGSEQDEQHLLAIRTRVNNIFPDLIVEDSSEALEVLLNEVAAPQLRRRARPEQQNLF